jgi:ATP-binding cassette subfamily B protein
MFRKNRRGRSADARPGDDDARRTLGRIWKELGRRDGAKVVLVVLMLAVQSSAQSAPPLVLRELLDAIPRRDVGAVYRMAAMLVALMIVFVTLSLWHRWLTARVGYGLLYRLRVKLYGHLARVSPAFFTRTPAGHVQSALTETPTLLRVMVGEMPGVLTRVFSVLGSAVVLYLLDPRLALMAYLLTPAIVVWSALAGRRKARIARDGRAAASRVSTLAREGMSVDGVIAMRTLAGRVLADQFRKECELIKRYAIREDVLVRWALMPVDLSVVLVTTGVYSYVAVRAIDGKSTPSVGTLVVFAGALASFLYGLAAAMERQLDLTGLLGRFAHIFALLDTKIEITPGTRQLSGDTPGELVFEEVSFRYGPELPLVLRDLTLRVPAGQCVALVGASGAGKTTLGLLAVRLYDPIAGEVSLDGVDIKQLSFDALHQVVGYIPQTPFLVDDTIRANICLGSPDATDEEIADAARKAQIHDWITGLEDGYETIVGTDGYRLSGGQRQRIVIARTLLMDPPLLVLDEATSALDNATQLEVDKALRQLARNRTTLLIAHRLSTVRRADQIVVLDGGRVVEVGTHEQLRSRGGAYAELVRAETP